MATSTRRPSSWSWGCRPSRTVVVVEVVLHVGDVARRVALVEVVLVVLAVLPDEVEQLLESVDAHA
eukprot:967487-Prymnesium_polylepis.1